MAPPTRDAPAHPIPEWIDWQPLRHISLGNALRENKDGSLNAIAPKPYWATVVLLPLIVGACFAVPFLPDAPAKGSAVVHACMGLIGLFFLFVWAVMLRTLSCRPCIAPEAQLCRNLPSPGKLGFAMRDVPFTEIRGIQILEHTTQNPETGAPMPWQRQVNLLLWEGSRLNMVCHAAGAKNQAQADAQLLARVFGVPVWEQDAPPDRDPRGMTL